MYFGQSILANPFLDIFFVQFQFSQNTFQVKNSIFWFFKYFNYIISKIYLKPKTNYLSKQQVSNTIDVALYGSILAAGLLSSKYPRPSRNVCVGIRTDVLRVPTP